MRLHISATEIPGAVIYKVNDPGVPRDFARLLLEPDDFTIEFFDDVVRELKALRRARADKERTR